jgi:hypothetical protein
MPRSVISPVTSRAGVTSKAGLQARLPGAATWKKPVLPSSLWPNRCVISRWLRSSIGISCNPSSRVQSMVGDGSAT